MNSRNLKLGLDYHGVIDQNLGYFSEFCRQAARRGCRIYVVTGGPEVKVRECLAAANIECELIFAITDYYQALGQASQRPDGSFKIADELWNQAKAAFCRRSRISLHIDDSAAYRRHFSTPFCLYDTQKSAGLILPNFKIDFGSSPNKALNEIEDILAVIGGTNTKKMPSNKV